MRTFAFTLLAALTFAFVGCEPKPTTQQKLDEASKEFNEAGERIGEGMTKTADAVTDMATEAGKVMKKGVNEAAESVKEATDPKDTTIKPSSDAVQNADPSQP